MVSGCSDEPAAPPDSEATTWVRTNVFGAQCRCHWGADSEANLDLYSPGLEGRLIGRPASQCKNRILVVRGDPDASYLMQKIVEGTPACGSQMAVGLPSQDLESVRAWITSLDRVAPLR